MATAIRQELEEEFLSTARKGREIALDALKPLVEAVHYVIPTMLAVRVPFVPLLRSAHEAVADGYDFAEHLLANQRQFADEVITSTSPLRPGRTAPTPVAAKAIKAGEATPRRVIGESNARTSPSG